MARMDVQTSGRSGRPDAVLFGVSGVSSASSPGGAQSEGFPLEENQVVPRGRLGSLGSRLAVTGLQQL